MAEINNIIRLYTSVLHEDILKYNLRERDIREAIMNMKDVYSPNPNSSQSEVLDVADYSKPSHRCAYLHKYAPLHTALTAEMLDQAIKGNWNFFVNLMSRSPCLNICSLGGGPGNDIVAVLGKLNYFFKVNSSTATIVDYMPQWKITFNDIIQELRYGGYGDLGEVVSSHIFDWSYVGANLLGNMSDEIYNSINSADFITMVKFISAASCKETSTMINRIFQAMKPGAAVLYIDNAGGGFHQHTAREAEQCNLQTIFGPLKHFAFKEERFNIKRFGYTPCLDTKVTMHVWMKALPNDIFHANFQIIIRNRTGNNRPHANRSRNRSRSRDRNRSQNRNQSRNQREGRSQNRIQSYNRNQEPQYHDWTINQDDASSDEFVDNSNDLNCCIIL